METEELTPGTIMPEENNPEQEEITPETEIPAEETEVPEEKTEPAEDKPEMPEETETAPDEEESDLLKPEDLFTVEDNEETDENEDADENDEKKKKFGVLYIVSTPIGNTKDITFRALESINHSDIVVCEEGKVGGQFLHRYNIKTPMELLNENNESEKTYEVIKLLEEGKKVSIVTDCGTPILADPGLLLVQECIKRGIRIVPVPGVTSIMTALVSSGFPVNSFLYAGFMSREKSVRINQLREIAKEPRTVAMLETPYRLIPLLEAMLQIMPNRRAYIGCNLTFPYETHHYGTISELYDKFTKNRFKGEFVVVIEGNLTGETALVPEATSVEHDKDDYKDEYRNNGSRFGGRRREGFGDRDRKPFDRDRKPFDRDRKPFDRDRKPFDRDRKPFDRDKKFGGSGKPFRKHDDRDNDSRRLPVE